MFRSYLKNLYVSLHVIRAPLLVLIFSSLCLVFPQQMIEIYRAIVQKLLFFITVYDAFGWETSKQHLGNIVDCLLMIAGICTVSIMGWFVIRIMLLRTTKKLPHNHPNANLSLITLPLIIASLPIVATALGLYRSMTSSPTNETREAVKTALSIEFNVGENAPPPIIKMINDLADLLLEYNETTLFVVMTVLIVGTVVIISCISFDKMTNFSCVIFRKGPWQWVIYLLTVFTASLGVIAYSIWPIALAQSTGVMVIFSLFCINLLLVFSTLSYWSDKTHIPFGGLLLIAALVFSSMELNDNHKIYSMKKHNLEGPSVRETQRQTHFSKQFVRWYESRKDKQYYEKSGLAYPVYIIAAQGGGIYAAFHTASVLGTLQDECPVFAQHTFAISGVSGGSIGASVFTSLVKTMGEHRASPPEEGCPGKKSSNQGDPITAKRKFVYLSDEILAKDFISPLIAGLVFVDIPQLFIPFTITKTDRSRRFEMAIEKSVDSVLSKYWPDNDAKQKRPVNYLKEPFVSHWRPEGIAPALLLNTTEVGSGRRVVISPFILNVKNDLKHLPIWQYHGVRGANQLSHMPVSTAASLSARFPWVTPSGWFIDQKGVKQRLVDGAYFENSGIPTAIDLIRNIQQAALNHGIENKIEINLIVLTRAGYPDQANQGISELAAPVIALFNARSARSFSTIDNAEFIFEKSTNNALSNKRPPNHGRIEKVRLRNMGYPLPLGWRLSDISLLLIRAQNGEVGQCSDNKGKLSPSRNYDTDCLKQRIYNQLTP